MNKSTKRGSLMKKITASAKKAIASKKTAAKPAPKKKTAAAKKSVPAKSAAKKSNVTVITANINIGFGNHLVIRGQGASLSWDAGLPLECIADDLWSITLPASAEPIAYKFLVNDLTWSAGDDYLAKPGDNIVVTPQF